MGCVSLSISLMYLFSLLLLPQHIQQNSCRRRERRLFIHQALECFTAIFKDYFCVAVTVWPVSDKDGDDNYSAWLLGSQCSVSGGGAKIPIMYTLRTAFLHLFFQVKLVNIYIMQKTLHVFLQLIFICSFESIENMKSNMLLFIQMLSSSSWCRPMSFNVKLKRSTNYSTPMLLFG